MRHGTMFASQSGDEQPKTQLHPIPDMAETTVICKRLLQRLNDGRKTVHRRPVRWSSANGAALD